MANNTNEYRFRSSTRNATVAIITQITMGIASFLERMVFNQCFIADYLGFYSLFKNIISVLSVAELGLSVAIAYSLYAPLAEDNWEEVNAIMSFLRKVYFAIGTVILLLGLALAPFLHLLVTTEIPMASVRLYFVVFLLSTVFEYYLSYKYILLTADQHEYVTTFITNTTWTVMYLVQICVSLFTHDFMIYSLCILLFDIARCIAISVKADKTYPELNLRRQQRLGKDSEHKITQNIKGLIFTKLGGVMVNSTDSILISALVGSSILGLYSNYQMITNGLLGFSRILPTAITASLGNMGATESNEHVADGYRAIDMSFFMIYGLLAVVLLNILNPIVGTFFGHDRCLPFSSALIISILFYLYNSKSLFDTYKSSLGLYWYDRYRPIISGIANIILSIVLGLVMGFNGILLATIITYVAIDLWVEPMIIYHRGFHASSHRYIIFAMARLLLVVLMMLASHYLSFWLPEFGLVAIMGRGAVALAVGALTLGLFFGRDKYVRQAIKAVKKFVFKKEG